MSRTYRRRHGLGNHTWNLWDTYDPEVRRRRQTTDEEYRKRLRYLHSEKYHPMSTPSWWISVSHTRPQRSQTRQLISKTMRLLDLEDTPLFPLAKKPHHYYW